MKVSGSCRCKSGPVEAACWVFGDEAQNVTVAAQCQGSKRQQLCESHTQMPPARQGQTMRMPRRTACRTLKRMLALSLPARGCFCPPATSELCRVQTACWQVTDFVCDEHTWQTRSTKLTRLGYPGSQLVKGFRFGHVIHKNDLHPTADSM